MVNREKEKGTMTKEEQLAQAMQTLHQYVLGLGEKAGKKPEETEDLWERIKASNGILRELAYYHDYGNVLCEYKVAGYTLADILVWQVDHFKAYLDRPIEMNRYHKEKLFLESLDVMSRMETNPEPYVRKMQGETGTDFVDKWS